MSNPLTTHVLNTATGGGIQHMGGQGIAHLSSNFSILKAVIFACSPAAIRISFSAV